VSAVYVYACMSMQDLGVWGMVPQKILEIRCSEIASEAILGLKQSHSGYMTCKVLHPVFGCPYMHLLC